MENVYETWINGDLHQIDLDTIWRETFALWDSRIDTETAEAIANATEQVLKARKAQS